MSRELTPAERIAWLRLARTDNVGPVTFAQLIGRFGTASRALDAIPDLARRGGRVSPLGIPSPAEIEAELDAGQRLGARLICSGDPDFPPLLKAIDPPPPVLWARGRVDLTARRAVALVGARVASAAGQRFARGLASELGNAGLVVVSGLARGIDGAAHEGALTTGTVAVLGGGVDDIYPPEHRDLYGRILSQGCILSENQPGRTATARDFPRRNRIISGLSLATVVIEAELRSGSLITARMAAEQGREVLAVPGSPLDPRAKGTNDLLRQGAAICEGVEDVLRAIEGQSGFAAPEPPAFEGNEPDMDLGTLRTQLKALLSPTPVSRDELMRATGAPASLILAALVELALAGQADLLAGGMVVVGEG